MGVVLGGHRGRAHRTRWLVAATVLLILAATGLVPRLTTPASASPGSYGQSTGMGVDSCGFNATTAHGFYSNTPYWNIGIYVGGANAGCPTGSSLANAELSQGWHALPLWVGPQSACSGYSNVISDNTSTAFSQGAAQESSMVSTMSSWGWNTDLTPVIFDLENYNTSNSTCVAAADSFIGGWSHNAKLSPAQIPAVYGSTCGSDLNSFASLGSNVPSIIDGADWDGNPSTWTLTCVPSGNWVYEQRIKQYNGGHYETWNGYTVDVDSDCNNAAAYPAGDNANEGCA